MNRQNPQKQKRKILCTWEAGGELGHIASLSTIAKALEREGYHVVVALKDLARAYPFFCDTNVTLLQAPVWLPKITLQRPIACLADTLLLLGYLEADPLHALVMAWQNLVDLVKPDLVIFNYSPTAMLALHHQPLPKILVGTGFADPVPGSPIADWRPYSVLENDDLIARQEHRALQQINTVLVRQGKPELMHLADLFATDRVMISTFPELDLYHKLRKSVDYCVGTVPPINNTPVQFANTSQPRIIAYLKPNYPQIEPLIAALAHCNANVFIACPQGRIEQFQSYLSDRFQVSVGLVNLQGAMKGADLFVCHGNGASVKESLANGIPAIVLPIQLEQLLTGKKIQECGFGELIEQIQTIDEMVGLLNSILENKERYCVSIARLLAQHPEPRLTIPAAVISACEELLAIPTNEIG